MSRSWVGMACAAVVLAAPVVGVAAGAGKAPVAPKGRPATKPAAKPPAGDANAPVVGKAAADGNRFFTEQIKPILQENCIACHGGDAPQGGLRLTSRAAFLKGGDSGPAIVAGKPAGSLVVAAVNYQDRRMPPKGKMAQPKIDALTRWIAMGAPWPAGDEASLEAKTHSGPPPVNAETMKFWSFQHVQRPPVPAVKGKAWVRNPIDAFVLAKLEASGLKPNPYANREALIRRAYYDLTGLPPSPEQVQAFVADKAPNAWEKVIDGLLASPRYGEKWGRHWLDLVRFAESNSYERDGTKPHIWRYRDYVINSFNADKPYDQFVTEQLAGDEMGERTPERIVATGYYRLGIWDDEPVDAEQALYDDLDDISRTTGEVFLGLTVGCARCHDHKIDPIPQKDYYRFLAFFSGVRRYGIRGDDTVAEASIRSISSPEVQEKERAEVAAHQTKLREAQTAIDAFERKVFADLEPVEKEEWRNEMARPQIARKRVGKLLQQEEFDGYVRLRGERRRLRETRPSAMDQALCVKELGPKPRPTFVLLRGNPASKGDAVEPGFLSVLAPPQPEVAPVAAGDTCGRRLALAKWVASKDNPLTARVMANRVWQYHFGRGIVRSASNFGFLGDKPTHPELLDWLASDLTDRGWKLKPLHKLIMMSAAYQMSSRGNPTALAKDPTNDLLWRYDMRRLEAEEVRDSILAANGSLNLKMGGPSFYTDMPAEVLAGQSMPGANWGKSSTEEQCRRSVYIFVKRSLAVPMIASFDGPETDFTCPARFATTQPTQALGMINSVYLNEQARVFAAFLKKQAGSDTAAQVNLALWRVMQRKPTPAEIQRGVKLIDTLQKDEKLAPDAALATFCVVALNLNEFIYLD